MSKNGTKTTILLIIALIVVCGGSFMGVKMLNKGSEPVTTTTAPVITTIQATTTAVTETSPTAAPLPTEPLIADVETKPAATTKKDAEAMNADTTKESTTKAKETESSDNNFTTFAVNGSSATTTTKANNTTSPVPSTSINANDFQVNSQDDADALIEDASKLDSGFLGYKYNPDGNYFYTANDPWQRNFGFNQLYDMGAPFIVFYYDTMRCKFRYNNMDYMMQFWKGQYGWVFLGAEIGLYYKPTDRKVEHYDCVSDADSIPMQINFYRNGDLKASTDYANYWWCTAFIPGTLKKFSDRSELEMRSRITMKDYAMLLAFCNSLKKNGLKLNEDFTVSGLDVFVIY